MSQPSFTVLVALIGVAGGVIGAFVGAFAHYLFAKRERTFIHEDAERKRKDEQLKNENEERKVLIATLSNLTFPEPRYRQDDRRNRYLVTPDGRSPSSLLRDANYHGMTLTQLRTIYHLAIAESAAAWTREYLEFEHIAVARSLESISNAISKLVVELKTGPARKEPQQSNVAEKD